MADECFAKKMGWKVQQGNQAWEWHVFRPDGTFHVTMVTEERARDLANTIALDQIAQALMSLAPPSTESC